MARDLAGWVALAETLAHENAAYTELAAWQGALAAVLRAVAAEHHPEPLHTGGTVALVCQCRGYALAWPCYYIAPVLAALAPLAPLFPDTEGGGDE